MPGPCPPSNAQGVVADNVFIQGATTHPRATSMRSGIVLVCEYANRLVADVVSGELDVRQAAAHLDEQTTTDGIGVRRDNPGSHPAQPCVAMETGS